MYQPTLSIPFAGMLMLTMLVWLLMYVKRLGYIRKHNIDPQSLADAHTLASVLPESINRPANNLRNLCELPVLFYAVVLFHMSIVNSDAVFAWCAWIFFIFRCIHSLVHCTFNRVTLRFAAYFISSIALWVMVLRTALFIAIVAQ